MSILGRVRAHLIVRCKALQRSTTALRRAHRKWERQRSTRCCRSLRNGERQQCTIADAHTPLEQTFVRKVQVC
jgi:hypothetical protein